MTTTTETVTGPTIVTRRLPRARVLLASFAFGLVLAAAGAAAGLYAYDQAHNGLIVHGVRVGAVDVSDLNRETAAERIRQGFASYAEGSATLADGDLTQTVSYAELGRGPDVDALLDQAFAVGRTGTIADRALEEVRAAFRGVDIQPMVTLDPAAVVRALESVGSAIDRPAVDASAAKTATGFTSTASIHGRAVGQGSTAAALVAALRDPDAPAQVTISLSVVSIPPIISTEAATNARFKAAAMATSVTIVAGKEDWTISAAKVRSWISFSWADGVYGPTLDVKAIRTSLRPLVKEIGRPARDAQFLIGKSGQIAGVTASFTGRSLDVNATAVAVQAAVVRRGAGGRPIIEPVRAALILKQPKLTTEVAQRSAPLMRRISSWTTYYQSNAHNGFSANISLPALAIDGTVVAPGQWFSFWQTVGEVSLAKGYKLGGAIVDGRSVEGKTIGGGICSTSTTIFNAALRAGFQMGARKNHFYYIARYPKGLDATVYKSDGGGVQDMTWRNDTPYPVLIKAYAVPGIVRFTLYSVPNGRTVSFTAPTVRNYSPSTTVVQYTTALSPGVRQQVEYEVAGFDAWVTRTVRDRSGAIIHSNTYYSHYARIVGLILVGRQAT
jgi:vancomycin resistance protein YoaR